MVDSENSSDNDKTLKISIGAIEICKNAVNKLPFVIRYVPDQYKTEEIYDKVILENDGRLRFVPDCYKNQKMYDKAVDNDDHALEFVPDCYKTPKICHKAVDTPLSAIQNAIRLIKYIRKLLIHVFLRLVLFLIDIRLKKCVRSLFSKKPFILEY